MAIRLGEINFGVGADDRPLDRSIQKMIKFSATVSRAASATGGSSRKIEADFRRQERAILKSLQAVLKFNREARSSGIGSSSKATTATVGNATKAFRQLTNEMTKGRASALTFDRAMGRFNATMGTSQRALRRFRSAQKSAAVESKFFGVSIRDLASVSVIALGPLSGLGAQIQAVSSIAVRTSFVIAGFIATITLAGVAVVKLGSAALATAQELDSINARLNAVTGSTSGAAIEFEKMRELADATGLTFKDLVNSFARLNSAAQGTGLEGAAVAQILEDLSFAAAKFRLPAEDVKGILKAIEQIMSKGTVTAEELRQQLGDRLTGAFNRAATAMGVTTIELNKMLKAGELLAVDFLPKFAKEIRRAFGAESVTRVESFQASINRLSNAVFFFNTEFNEAVGVSKVYRAILDLLTSVINSLTRNMDLLVAATTAVTFGFLGLIGPGIVRGLVAIIGFLKKISGFLIGAAGAATGLGLALKVGLRFLIGASAGLALFAGATASAAESQNRLIDSIDAFIAAQNNAKQTALEAAQQKRREVVNSIEAARRSIVGLKRELDSLSPRPSATEIVSGFDSGAAARRAKTPERLRAAAVIQGKINELAEVQVRLRESLAKIIKQEAIELGKVAALEEQRATARTNLLASIDQTISRIRQQADAIREGVVASAILARNFKDIDRLARIKTDILKADPGLDTRDPEAFKAKMDEASAAIMDFNAAVRSAAIEGIVKITSRMNAVAAAASENEGSISRLNRELADTAAAEQFGIRYGVIAKNLKIGELAATAYGTALAVLRKNQDRVALEALDKQIDRINGLAEAMRKGKGAVELFNAAFERTDKIEAFTKALLTSADVNTSADVIRSKLDAFKASLDAIASSKAEQVITDFTAAIALLNAEVVGISSGTDSFDLFQQELSDNKFIDDWRQKLIKAKGSTEEAEEALKPLIAAMAHLRDVSNQVAIDDALAGIARQVVNLRLENEALAKGPKAIDAFRDATGVVAVLAVEEKALAKLGIEGAEATFQLEGLRKELERQASLERSLKDSKNKDPLKALSDVEQTIKRIRLEVLALRAGPDAVDSLQRQFDIEDQLASTLDNLLKQGVAADVAAAKVLKLREALIALANMDQEIQRIEALKDINRDLDRLADTIAAMETGSPRILEDLQKAFDREDDIRAFRKSLDPLIFTQDEINEKTAEYVRLINRLDELGPIFERQVEAMKILERAVDTLGSGIEEIFIGIARDGEFSLRTLGELTSQVIEQMLRDFFRLQVIKPLLDSIFGSLSGGKAGGSGSKGGIFGSILGAASSLAGPLLGSFGGGSILSPSAANAALPPGFAHGGSFMVGGRGGTDANILPLRLTRGERVDITPRGQSMGGGGGNTFFIDASGADPAAIARLEVVLRETVGPGKIEQRSNNAIIEARRRKPNLFTRSGGL